MAKAGGRVVVRGSLSDAGGWAFGAGLLLGVAAGLALGLSGALGPGAAAGVGAAVAVLVFVVVWRRWWVAIDDAGIVVVRPLRRTRLPGATLLRATNVVWVAGGGHDRKGGTTRTALAVVVRDGIGDDAPERTVRLLRRPKAPEPRGVTSRGSRRRYRAAERLRRLEAAIRQHGLPVER